MKHIGVVSHLRLPDLPTELKRYALFFDEVQIVGMDLEEVKKVSLPLREGTARN